MFVKSRFDVLYLLKLSLIWLFLIAAGRGIMLVSSRFNTSIMCQCNALRLWHCACCICILVSENIKQSLLGLPVSM